MQYTVSPESVAFTMYCLEENELEQLKVLLWHPDVTCPGISCRPGTNLVELGESCKHGKDATTYSRGIVVLFLCIAGHAVSMIYVDQYRSMADQISGIDIF